MHEEKSRQQSMDGSLMELASTEVREVWLKLIILTRVNSDMELRLSNNK